MKNVVADTSSLILLYKAGLLDLVLQHYEIGIVSAVFSEVARPGYPGADAVRVYRQQGRIRLIALDDASSTDGSRVAQWPRMGDGERDTIRAYLVHGAHFVLIDDGIGAGYCRQAGIPYINALLVPRILCMGGRITPEAHQRYHHRILRNGRYSAKIVQYAESCGEEALTPFL